MAVTDARFTAVFSGGTATVRFRPTNRASYLVQQVTVEYATAPIGCTCEIRKNGSLVTPMIPTGDAASGEPPIPLSNSDIMTVVFSNGTNGQVANVYIVYDDGTQ